MMTEQQLLDLKAKVETAKTAVAGLKGQQKALMDRLRIDWKCNTIQEAEKKLKTMEGEVAALNEKLKKGIADLELKYNSF